MSTWRERDAITNLEEVLEDLYATVQLLDAHPALAVRTFELTKDVAAIRKDLVKITSRRQDKPS